MGKEIDGTWFSVFTIALMFGLSILFAITISDEEKESFNVDYFEQHSEIK